MKSFTLSVMASALIAGAVATDPHVKRQAEILASLPACVQNCLLTAFSEHGTSCSPTDFSCLCSLSDFIMASGNCYLTCDAADQAAGMDFGKKSCASVGITLPDLPGGAAPSAPATPAAPETPAAPAPSAAPAAPVKPTTPEATHPALPETPCVWLPKSMHPTAHNGTGSTSSMMNSTMDVTFNVTIVGAHNLGLNTSTWNGLPVCPETCNTTSAPTMPMTPATPAAPVTPAAPAKNTSYTAVDASSSASKKELTISATVIVALVGFFFF
ncbi:uncharacterized protein MELLADRAFT_124458 [Melampsora larici-populina 98AG31]|uniref:CFEM domain-containing protein n=1 Tax=Melampsora larici-populina (strain 98AG31 / pathotype 3-4-7) TaxID=747676 RepID=F4RBM4_MELLP|nr:uncharacterized protein MELLADRAFT_124458 [Melampsora larici-populina 98AG31]EGG10309.1 hypothetical protein MELLADRAFT_124458 [Melampsora larici-populina 98AG31]